MQGIYIKSTDPFQNLALEDYLFNSLARGDEGYFLLWHNAPSIIVGRHQNTLQEINQELVNNYELPVIRRMTGGGAVYHDLGNLNFSFLRPLRAGERTKIDFAMFLQPILNTLQELGVKAEFSSRNDLVCNGRKISGSAQLRRTNLAVRRVLHHGTLMVNLDLDMLGTVLSGAPDKYLSKGISSIRSRVANLEEFLPAHVGMEELKQSLMQNCAREIISLDTKILEEAKSLAHDKYSSYEWNYGASPPFTEKRRQRFEWGLVECHIDVRQGRIESLRIFGDFFSDLPLNELENVFNHIPYTAEDVQIALQRVNLTNFFSGCKEQVMRDFFCKF